MGRALEEFIKSLKKIDEQRVTLLSCFPSTEHEIVQKNAGTLADVCERIAKTCLEKVTKEIREADRRIEALQSRAEIGLTVEVKRTWNSAA